MAGGEAKSYKNKGGNYQPIVDGKFTKSAGNPGDSLRSGLIRAATALEPIYRGIKVVPLNLVVFVVLIQLVLL